MSAGLVVNLFGGPGGWEAETRDLCEQIGVEHDGPACATRAAPADARNALERSERPA
jgi:hypothetical protein